MLAVLQQQDGPSFLLENYPTPERLIVIHFLPQLLQALTRLSLMTHRRTQ